MHRVQFDVLPLTLLPGRRLTCPRNECGSDKNLTDGQNIFDVFSFSKYFASSPLLIIFPSQHYLSFVPQAHVSGQNEHPFSGSYIKDSNTAQSESSIKCIATLPPKDFRKSGRSDVERGVGSVCNQTVPPFMCPLH